MPDLASKGSSDPLERGSLLRGHSYRTGVICTRARGSGGPDTFEWARMSDHTFNRLLEGTKHMRQSLAGICTSRYMDILPQPLSYRRSGERLSGDVRIRSAALWLKFQPSVHFPSTPLFCQRVLQVANETEVRQIAPGMVNSGEEPKAAFHFCR